MKATEAAREPAGVREAVVAGSFYPVRPAKLRAMVETLLAEARASPAPTLAAIAPHAGYEFSGGCAAAVFARIAPPSTVVVIAPNHYEVTSKPAGASLWRAGAFATPLGEVAIDETLANALLETCPLVADDRRAHRLDHAIEVELPFLIIRAGPRRPALVPLLLTWDDWPRCRELARALVAVVRQRKQAGSATLLLASSDMTHFAPAEEAFRRDRPALTAVEQLDGEALLRCCRDHEITMCGRGPAAVVVEAARQLGATSGRVVAHTHSGFVSGDFSSVVSYAGVVVPAPAGGPAGGVARTT